LPTTANGRWYHCEFVNTNAGSSTLALSGSGTFIACYCKVPSTANVCVSAGGSYEMYGCYYDGQGGATTVGHSQGTGTLFMDHCTVQGFGSHGVSITVSGNAHRVLWTTFNANGGDAYRISGTPAVGTAVVDCLFRLNSGWDINNATGTPTFNLTLANNGHYNLGSGALTGQGDYPELGAITLASDPCNSSTDLRVLAASTVYTGAVPNLWETPGQTLTGNSACGAWGQNPSSGSAGVLVTGGMTGGLRG
jgi:hypothetical protein